MGAVAGTHRPELQQRELYARAQVVLAHFFEEVLEVDIVPVESLGVDASALPDAAITVRRSYVPRASLLDPIYTLHMLEGDPPIGALLTDEYL